MKFNLEIRTALAKSLLSQNNIHLARSNLRLVSHRAGGAGHDPGRGNKRTLRIITSDESWIHEERIMFSHFLTDYYLEPAQNGELELSKLQDIPVT